MSSTAQEFAEFAQRNPFSTMEDFETRDVPPIHLGSQLPSIEMITSNQEEGIRCRQLDLEVEEFISRLRPGIGIIRGGATKDPLERAQCYYSREGYSGEMLYVPTTNMKEYEDELLKHKGPGLLEYNVQITSNQKNEPGYIYIIIGRKR